MIFSLFKKKVFFPGEPECQCRAYDDTAPERDILGEVHPPAVCAGEVGLQKSMRWARPKPARRIVPLITGQSAECLPLLGPSGFFHKLPSVCPVPTSLKLQLGDT